jgi:hypothetical protein
MIAFMASPFALIIGQKNRGEPLHPANVINRHSRGIDHLGYYINP